MRVASLAQATRLRSKRFGLVPSENSRRTGGDQKQREERRADRSGGATRSGVVSDKAVEWNRHSQERLPKHARLTELRTFQRLLG